MEQKHWYLQRVPEQKFPEKITIIKDGLFTMGRSRKLHPCGDFNHKVINGINVSRFHLHFTKTENEILLEIFFDLLFYILNIQCYILYK